MANKLPAERVATAAVAANVRAELARQNLTQHDLAERLGVSRAALQRRLSGAVGLTVDDAFQVAAVLGVRPSVIFPEGPPPAANPPAA